MLTFSQKYGILIIFLLQKTLGYLNINNYGSYIYFILRLHVTAFK